MVKINHENGWSQGEELVFRNAFSVESKFDYPQLLDFTLV